MAVFLFSSVAGFSMAKNPECSDPNNWAAAMAHIHLKNAKLISNEAIDFSKTKVKLMASEKLSSDVYRQIHLVTFVEKAGHQIEVITSNEASSKECSMSPVQVFVISEKLGG
ncbi:hypothetical protein [Chitinilyticum litopenaei]|uniref:hypothetical protein n=1 Tax=Chitinilyticum litopenaei TaxID=1121276 RepID=UPI001B7FD180|nr:hypothetical protein [Chitinilyticum litopenaei]